VNTERRFGNRALLPLLFLLVSFLSGPFVGEERSFANTSYGGLYYDGPTADCDAYLAHMPNLYYYPYASTSTGISISCFATETRVYWPYLNVATSSGGGSTYVVGGTQGDPFRSDHRLCSGVYQCGGLYQMY
jgi:hypothetical protein